MQNIHEIDDLIRLISKLPGLGPKSAKRIALKLINNREELIKPMAKALADVYKNISSRSQRIFPSAFLYSNFAHSNTKL